MEKIQGQVQPRLETKEEKWEKVPLSQKEYLEKTYSGYNNLNDKQKALYLQINEGVKNMDESIQIEANATKEDVELVNEMILADHPEYFWSIGGGKIQKEITSSVLGKEEIKMIYVPEYTESKDDKNIEEKEIESVADKWLEGISEDANDYEKVKYVFDTVINHADYDLNSKENQNIKSVFLYGSTVCSGYTKATQYLLTKLGIPCNTVRGTINGENHVWNLVKVNGQWFWLDTTTGNQKYSVLNQYVQYKSYDYFLCSTSKLLETHVISDKYHVPDVPESYKGFI